MLSAMISLDFNGEKVIEYLLITSLNGWWSLIGLGRKNYIFDGPQQVVKK